MLMIYYNIIDYKNFNHYLSIFKKAEHCFSDCLNTSFIFLH